MIYIIDIKRTLSASLRIRVSTLHTYSPNVEPSTGRYVYHSTTTEARQKWQWPMHQRPSHRVGVLYTLGLGHGNSPTFTIFSAINFYHFRANIGQHFYRPRPPAFTARFTDTRQLSRRAASYAAQRATPRIPPKLSSDTASFVPRHGLATQLRVALLARLLPSHTTSSSALGKTHFFFAFVVY